MTQQTQHKSIFESYVKSLGDFELQSKYITQNKKITLKHLFCNSIFTTTPNSFTNRTHKCPVCKKTNFFINLEKKFREVHKNKYNYKMNTYNGMLKNMTIICPVHGDFEQTPVNHEQGKNCKYCNIENSSGVQMTTENFIDASNKKHNYFYNYSKTIYKMSLSNVIIICPVHGEFTQKAQYHSRGSGCPECGLEKCSINNENVYKNKKTILYYIKIENQYKIGIALYKNNVLKSLKNRYRTNKDYDKIELIDYEIYMNGINAYRKELSIKNYYSNYKIPKEDMILSTGNTETYTYNVLNDKLINFMSVNYLLT